MTQTKERAAPEIVIRPNNYATLLVHAEPGLASSHRIEVAGRLARDLGARLIGLGAETLEPIPTPDPITGFGAAEWLALAQDQIGKNLDAAEAVFRRDAGGADIEWRAVQDYPSQAMTRLARAADLIVVGPRGAPGLTRTVDPADVVMGAGRPVLVVPDGQHHLRARAVVIAWKDTRESRRAVADALPFLQRAEDVIVHVVCKPDEADRMVFEADDVVANLKRHGVEARTLVTTERPEGVAWEIERVAKSNSADLIVCGAYGHSRLHEWAFGGVTDDLLHRPGCFVLMSH